MDGQGRRITKRMVDSMGAGTVIWDGELRGFGVRRQRRDPTFVLKYTRKGRQRFVTIGRYGSFTVDMARAEARKLLGVIAGGGDPAGEREARSAKKDFTVSELCSHYLADGPLLKPNKKGSSWDCDRSNIRRHIIPILGGLLAKEVTEIDVARFVAAICDGETGFDERTRPRGRAIIKGGKGVAIRARAVLSAVFAFGIRSKILSVNPVVGVRAPKLAPAGHFLDAGEWKRLGEALAKAMADGERRVFAQVIYMLAITGCRKSEIANLRWSEVDVGGGYLRLADSKVGARVVVLGDAALEFLVQLKESAQADWVFPSRRGEGPVVGLYKVWNQIRTDAGLVNVRLHDLRHSFASQAVNTGASLYVTGAILGHRQASTTQRYAHLRSSPIRAVASAAGKDIVDALQAGGVDHNQLNFA